LEQVKQRLLVVGIQVGRVKRASVQQGSELL
jgi:hypothetical protein